MAFGTVLSQLDDNADERVIQYHSFQFNATQRNWPIIEKVAFAIIYAIQCLRTYLYEATFTDFTDHKPLKFLFQSKTVKNPKFQRWSLLLSEYNAQIQYCTGKSNTRAHALSRLPVQSDHMSGTID